MQVEEHNTDRVGHVLDFFHQLWSLQKHKPFSLASSVLQTSFNINYGLQISTQHQCQVLNWEKDQFLAVNLNFLENSGCEHEKIMYFISMGVRLMGVHLTQKT